MSSRETQHKLKRPSAREILRYLATPVAIPAIADLRLLRQSKNITLTTAENHFHLRPSIISALERGQRRHDTLTNNYRQWLHTA